MVEFTFYLFIFFSFSGGLQTIQVMTERIQVYMFVFIKPLSLLFKTPTYFPPTLGYISFQQFLVF